MRRPPELIRFHGAFYRKALEGEDREYVENRIDDFIREQGQEPSKEPAPGEPAEEGRRLAPTPEEVEAIANSALDSLVAASAHAEDLMQRAGIKYKGDFMYSMGVPAEKATEGGEEDEDEATGWNVVVGGEEGVEVTFDVAVNNLTANFQDEPLAIFDYRVFDNEGRGFWKSLWHTLKNVGNFGADHELHEFIFHFCTHNFGASADDKELMGELLEAVGFIQNPSKVVKLQGAARIKLKDNVEEANKVELVTDALAELMEEEQEEAQAGYPMTRWDDIEQVKRTIDRRRQQRYFTKSEQNVIVKVLEDAPDYKALIQQAADKARGGTPAAKGVTLSDRVEKFVKKLTADEGYSGGVRIYVDLRTNAIVAEIDAPYKFRYYIKKHPGGNLELDHASMKMCDYEFVVNTEQNAKELLAHDVTFGIAYGVAVNPKKTKKYAKNDLQAVIQKQLEEAEKKLQSSKEEAGGEVEKPMG